MPVVNKVIVHGETKIDLTQDTVTPNVLEEGYTAHNAAGETIVGISPGGPSKVDKLTTDGLHVYSHDGETQGELEVSDHITDTDYTQIPSVAAVKELADTISQDLENYYTKQEVDEALDSLSTLTLEVVTVLPTRDIHEDSIYLVQSSDPETGNQYDEYIYVNQNWELIGSTKVDLSSYYTKSEIDQKFEEYAYTAGNGITITNNSISIEDGVIFDCGHA